MKFMTPKQSLLISAVLTVAGVFVIAFLSSELQARKRSHAFKMYPPQTGLPVHGNIQEFALTDSGNNPFENSALVGQVWVADFIFTSCAGICPTMTANMAKIQEIFAERADVRFVSFSVDPETDTPDVLKAYGERYGADSERWHFLTGETDYIHRLAVDGFKIGSTDDPLIHSPHFVLVDRQGQIRGYYTGTDSQETVRLVQDINLLLGEEAN